MYASIPTNADGSPRVSIRDRRQSTRLNYWRPGPSTPRAADPPVVASRASRLSTYACVVCVRHRAVAVRDAGGDAELRASRSGARFSEPPQGLSPSLRVHFASHQLQLRKGFEPVD